MALLETRAIRNEFENNQTQTGVFLDVPQVDGRLLEKFSWLIPYLHYVILHPRIVIQDVEIPNKNMIPGGELFRILYAGVCGSDRKIAGADMGPSFPENLPNVDPRDLESFLRFQRWFGTHFLHWDPKEVANVLWPLHLGHEIIVVNENGQIGVIFTPNSCLKYGELNDENAHLYCEQCKNGDHNLCDNTDKGPLRGAGIGAGLVTEQGEDPGAGMGQILVAPKSTFIPLPGEFPKDKIPLALFTDAAACGFNVEEIARNKANANKNSTILIIGGGTMGFVTGLAFKDYPSVFMLTKYANQSKLTTKLGVHPIFLERTGGRNSDLVNQFDIVIEAVGTNRSLEDAYRFVKKKGTVIELGLVENARFDNHRGSVKQVGTERAFWAAKRHFVLALEAILEHLVPNFEVNELINTGFTLDDAKFAFQKSRVLKNAFKIA